MAGTYRYRISPRDVDASLRARVCALGDLVLQAAGDDADMLGFGVSDLNLGNASWVLSRMAVQMRRRPRRGERIGVYTWVSDYGRLFTTRNMVIGDEAGEEIGAAVTLWAMIDLDTRRPLDLSQLANKGTSLVDRQPPIERPRKVGAFECTTERPHEVVYSDIDFNGHVNSMKYVEWMIDGMPHGVPEAMDALRFEVNYLHEARIGETLSIGSGEDIIRCGRCHFDIRNGEGASICKATITT